MPDGPIRFVRKRRILAELDVNASTLWSWEKSGQFPQSVVLNPGADREIKAWREDTYEEWKASRPTRMARPARRSPYPTRPHPKKPKGIGRPKK